MGPMGFLRAEQVQKCETEPGQPEPANTSTLALNFPRQLSRGIRTSLSSAGFRQSYLLSMGVS